MSTYTEVWDPAVPPGGFVCGECGMPVESEPCDEHAPEDWVPEPNPCGHAGIVRGCGGCDPSAIDFVIEDDGTTRPFDPTRDLLTPTTKETQ